MTALPRLAFPLLALALVLPVAASPAAGAAVDEHPAKASEAAYRGLAADVLGHDPPPHAAEDPLDVLQDGVLNASTAPTNDTLAAWREARSANDSKRQALYEAEAALLDLAYRNLEEALDRGNATSARDWLAVIRHRARAGMHHMPVHTPGGRVFGHPGETAPGSPDRVAEQLREDAHAALAVRARELVVQAVLLNRTDADAAAAASAVGAARVVDILEPRGVERLPPKLQDPLRENATSGVLVRAVQEAPPPGSNYVLTGVLAPLTSLEMNHQVEPLEEWGARNMDAAVAVARSATEDPAMLAPLLEGAWKQYRADRGTLGIAGEGSLEASDDAFRDLRNASHLGSDSRGPDAPALRTAAGDAAEAIRDLALMRQGLVIEVTSGGVRPDRTHRYDVDLVKPPLEGLARIEALEVRWDPAIVEVVGAEAGVPELDLQVETSNETTRVNGTFDPPRNASSHAVKLLLEARGPPETTSPLNVTEARFAEADGDPVPVYIVRDGKATVANITSGGEDPLEEPPGGAGSDDGSARGSPVPAWVAVAALGTGCLVRRGGGR